MLLDEMMQSDECDDNKNYDEEMMNHPAMSTATGAKLN